VLEVEEIRRLIGSATGVYGVAIALAIATGLRQGELLGLKWGDIDSRGN
jgi:integrase